MKNPTVLILTLALALGCSKSESASSDVSFTSAAPPPTGAPTAVAVDRKPIAGDTQVARFASGTDLVTVHLRSDPSIVIVLGGSTTTLNSDTKDSGKRKYYMSGTQVAEVKPSDSGFKVRTSTGALLWKVRIADDKIKISDNEENLNPWVLKTGYPDKAKILDPRETEIGVVRFADATTPTRLRTMGDSDVWTVESSAPSAAWGTLMMSGVSREHQAIIIAELLARGH